MSVNPVMDSVDKLIYKLPPNRFLEIDGKNYMLIAPKELVEYSYDLARAMIGLEDTQKGTTSAHNESH